MARMVHRAPASPPGPNVDASCRPLHRDDRSASQAPRTIQPSPLRAIPVSDRGRNSVGLARVVSSSRSMPVIASSDPMRQGQRTEAGPAAEAERDEPEQRVATATRRARPRSRRRRTSQVRRGSRTRPRRPTSRSPRRSRSARARRRPAPGRARSRRAAGMRRRPPPSPRRWNSRIRTLLTPDGMSRTNAARSTAPPTMPRSPASRDAADPPFGRPVASVESAAVTA